MTTTMEEQSTKSNPAARPWRSLVWVKCPLAVVALGFEQTLEEAGYACCAQQRAPVGKSPSFVLCWATGEEDAAAEVKALRGQAPDARVLVLGLHADAPLAREALLAGADGFVHAGMRASQIESALAFAAKGDIVLPRELVANLIKGEEPADLSALTPRQRKILELVDEGLTNAEIAERIFLSEFTIKQHLRGTYKALKVRNRNEAARLFRKSVYYRTDP
jgi:DNA-binding NarL/FixJ family response regulator